MTSRSEIRRIAAAARIGLAAIYLAVPPAFAGPPADPALAGLLEAIAASDPEAVQRLIATLPREKLNADIEFGNTILHRAVGSYAGVALALRKDFNPDRIVDPDNRRRMIEQRQRNEEKKPAALAVVKQLLDAGADPNARNKRGLTPLLSLNQYYGPYTELIELLIKHGADINAADNEGNTVLHLSLRHSDPGFEFGPLFDLGADLNRQNLEGESPLMLAAINKPEQTVRQFLDKGADVKAATKRGATALHYAAQWNNWRAMELLLQAGANLEAHDAKGATPLSYAVERKQWNMARRLLEKGANSNVPVSGDRMTVADVILETPAAGLTDLISKKTFDASQPLTSDATHGGFGFSALYSAVQELDADRVAKYLELGADPNAGGGSYWVPLQEVANYGWESRSERRRQSAQWQDKLRNAERIFYLLLEHGADPNIRNHEGRTPLMVTAAKGSIKASAALLDRGADIDTADAKGVTALMQAAGSHQWNTARLLVDRGADVVTGWPLEQMLASYSDFLTSGMTQGERKEEQDRDWRLSREVEKEVRKSMKPGIRTMRESLMEEARIRWRVLQTQFDELVLELKSGRFTGPDEEAPDGASPEGVADEDYGGTEFVALVLATLEAVPADYALDLDNYGAATSYRQLFENAIFDQRIRDAAARLRVQYKPDGYWAGQMRRDPQQAAARYPAAALSGVKTAEQLKEEALRRASEAAQEKQRKRLAEGDARTAELRKGGDEIRAKVLSRSTDMKREYTAKAEESKKKAEALKARMLKEKAGPRDKNASEPPGAAEGSGDSSPETAAVPEEDRRYLQQIEESDLPQVEKDKIKRSLLSMPSELKQPLLDRVLQKSTQP